MLDLLASRIPLVIVHSAVSDQMLDSVASYERDGTIVYINPAACRHIGASSEELVGKRLWELFPEARGTAFHQAFERVASTGNSDQFEHFYPPRGRWYANQIYLADNLVWVIGRDITEHKLREDYHAFLLKLSDTLRPLADPEKIQAVAADLLGAHLRVNHSHYGEVRGEYVCISHSYADGLPPMTGSFHADDFGKRAMDGYRAGKLQVSVNTATDPIFSAEERQALQGQHIGAYVAVPLVKSGEWVGVLGVQSIEPREWAPSEIELVQEVAERTWAAVQYSRAEKALSRSEEKYRSLFESMDEGVCTVEVLFDEHDEAVDYRLLEINSAHEAMSGLGRDVIGKRGRELIPNLEQSVIERLGQVVLTGQRVRVQEYVSGLDRWFDIYLARDGGSDSRRVVSVFNNITERKRRERHAAFLDKLSQALTLLDSPEEIIRATGEALGEHLGLGFFHLADVNLSPGSEPAEARITVLATWEREGFYKASGSYRAGDFLSGEFLRACRAGETIAVRDTDDDPRADAAAYRAIGIRAYVAVPILKEGEWPGLIAVGTSGLRDWRPDEVTLIVEVAHRVFPRIERVRADAALRASRAELTEADRRKNEFLAMLGHELRNPLAALAHGLELMGKVVDDTARSEELRAVMVRQTERIGILLDQLLEISRVISGKIELSKTLIDLADVVRAAVEIVRPSVETQKHKLTLLLPPDKSALVLGDAVRLAQIVENVLTNAAKYTDKGGQIEVTLESDQDTAQITVRDNGIGMSAELLPHVFEVFTQGPRTLDRSKGGMGLGLPLVQRLVEMHGGRVTAESAGPDKGSVFVVTLPCTHQSRLDKQEERLERESVPVQPGRATPRRILVVDDETDTAETFAELLERDGHKTLAVSDGAAALEAVSSFDPEVVLLDLGLPEMDGYEVARTLREKHEDHKILLIAVTGYQRDDSRLRQAGFDDHLLKPSSARKLTALLAKWDTGKGGAK